MNTAPVVRLATREDSREVLNLWYMLYQENAISSWDNTCVSNAIAKAIANNLAFIGVIGPIGEPVAVIHLVIEPLWYTRDLHLRELGMFVHPDHRRSNYAKLLIGFAKQASDHLDMPLLMSVASTHRTEQKIRLFRRQLGPIAGANWLYNGKTGRR
jgi:hypothetical protein